MSSPEGAAQERESRRLLSLLNASRCDGGGGGDKTLTESDVGALLGYLDLYLRTGGGQSGGDDGSGGEGGGGGVDAGAVASHETFLSVVHTSLRAAHASTVSDSTNSAAAGSTAPMTPRLARRLVTDGLLPLSSSPHAFVNEAVWRCVLEIAGCALTKQSGGDSGDDGEADSGAGAGGSSSTLGIEVLLPSYLSRVLRCPPPAPPLPGDGDLREAGGASSAIVGIDGAGDALDALTSHPSASHVVRPDRAAAVASALGELEGINPGALTRFPPKAAAGEDKATKSGKKGASSIDDGGKGRTTDRVGSLASSLLRSLRSLSESTDPAEWDSLPPVVYQLCRLPSRMSSSVSKADRGGSGGVADGHRTAIMAGIASVFDDLLTRTQRRGGSSASASSGGSASDARGGDRKAEEEAARWASSTSLSHVASALRVDPDLASAALKLASDGSASASPLSLSAVDDSGEAAAAVAPFRYLRLTPFRLSILLTLAGAVPRTRSKVLDAVRDLAVEEETLRQKRGDSRWINALCGSILAEREMDRSETGRVGENADATGNGASGSGRNSPPNTSLPGSRGALPAKRSAANSASQYLALLRAECGGRGVHGRPRNVLHCLLTVSDFACSHGGGGVEGGSSLLQTLIAAGFHLVDHVRRDADVAATPAASGGGSFDPTIAERAPKAAIISSVAGTGRAVLRYLFVRCGTDVETGEPSSGPSAVCRAVLSGASDRYCGMAPNALEHARLVRELALGRSPTLSPIHDGGTSDGGGEDAQDDGASSSALSILATHHLPALLDQYSHLPSGGMPPHVALHAVLPTIEACLRYQLRTRALRRDFEDNADYLLLLTKKALFCVDHGRRGAAGRALCVLGGVLAEYSALERLASEKKGAVLDGGDDSVADMEEEVRGYLRRSLTQHQSSVRSQAYAGLVLLLPATDDDGGGDASAPNSPMPGAATTPPPGGGISPAMALSQMSPVPPGRRHGSAAGGSSSAAPPARGSCRHRSKKTARAVDGATRAAASSVLLSQLERVVTVAEDEDAKKARRERASRHGSQLSQRAADSDDDDDDSDEEGDEAPLRLELCLSKSPSYAFETASFGSAGRGRKGAAGSKGGKKGKKRKDAGSLLEEAMAHISEPLPRLLASCYAALASGTTSSSTEKEAGGAGHDLRKALTSLRRRAAKSGVDAYLPDVDGIEEVDDADKALPSPALAAARCLLLASAAEVLMESPPADGGSADDGENDDEEAEAEAKVVGGLHRLRSEALSRAASAIASALAAAATKTAKKKPTKKGKKGAKRRRNDDDENAEPNEGSDDGEDDDEGGGGNSTSKSGASGRSNGDKLRRAAEAAVAGMVPMTPSSLDFLAGSLRRYGAGAERKLADKMAELKGGGHVGVVVEEDSDEEDDENLTNIERLARDLALRRLLIERSLRLLDGSSPVVRPGRLLDLSSSSSCCSSTNNGDDGVGDDGAAEDLRSLCIHRLAASLQLGPLLLSEFASHASERERTSLHPQPPSEGATDLPLARLCLRSFAASVARISDDFPGQQLGRARRAATLLDFAMRRVGADFPESKARWNTLLQRSSSGNAGDGDGDEEDDAALMRAIRALVQPPPSSTAAQDDEGQKGSHCRRAVGGLLSELVAHGADGEASECCRLVSRAASCLADPDRRQTAAAMMLRCWGDDVRDDDDDGSSAREQRWEGPLGLDHDAVMTSHGSCASAAAVAVQTACDLGGGLDGDSAVPPSLATVAGGGNRETSSTSAATSIRVARSAVGLPLCRTDDWPDRHRPRLEADPSSSRHAGTPCVPLKVATALLSRFGVGHNFEGNFTANGGGPSRKHYALPVVDVLVASPPGPGRTISKHVGSAIGALSAAMDACLTDAEFVAGKVLPPLLSGGCGNEALNAAHDFASGRLLAVAKMVNVASACAVSADDDGTFASSLLKACARLYAALAKVVHSRSAHNPRGLVESGGLHRRLLRELSARTTPRVTNLLLSVQEKSEAGGEGKYMGDKRLESQGRVAARVVFEKEKSDTALVRACARLKAGGMERESAWLEKNVVASVSRDFRIKPKQIEGAREREAAPAKTKRAGKKKAPTKEKGRGKSGEKRKSQKKSSASSKKRRKKRSSDDDNDGDDSSSEIDNESMAGSSEMGESAIMVEAAVDDGSDEEIIEGEAISDGDDLTESDED